MGVQLKLWRIKTIRHTRGFCGFCCLQISNLVLAFSLSQYTRYIYLYRFLTFHVILLHITPLASLMHTTLFLPYGRWQMEMVLVLKITWACINIDWLLKVTRMSIYYWSTMIIYIEAIARHEDFVCETFYSFPSKNDSGGKRASCKIPLRRFLSFILCQWCLIMRSLWRIPYMVNWHDNIIIVF